MYNGEKIVSTRGLPPRKRAHRRGWISVFRVSVCYAVSLIAIYTSTALAESGAVTVEDDAGQTVTLAEPARRIVSLAPHITEILFAAGAGTHVVGAPAYSDFPDAAKAIARIGDARGLDLERIVALSPDLVVAWRSGNPVQSLQKLERFGIPMFLSEPRSIEDVATNIDRLGLLAGSSHIARQASAAFRKRHEHLRLRYAQRTPVTIFYQVWHQPLMTVNGAHLISDVMRLCGGVNVFEDLPTLTARIDVEAVLEADPSTIVAAGTGDSRTLDGWHKWPRLRAVENNNLFLIPYPLIARHSPRILEGAQRLCVALEKVRAGSK